MGGDKPLSLCMANYQFINNINELIFDETIAISLHLISMKDVICLLFHLLATIAKLARPGGSHAVIAEDPLVKQKINLAFGLDLDKDTVRRALAAHYKPDPSMLGPSWLTALGHAKGSLWSVDLFRAESITLRTHWIMVVMDQYTRQIIGFAVHAGNVDGPAVCRMINEATSGQGWPERLSSDNDPLFQYYQWKANLRVLEIKEIKSLPHVPMSFE